MGVLAAGLSEFSFLLCLSGVMSEWQEWGSVREVSKLW